MNDNNTEQHITIDFRGNPESKVFEDVLGYQLGSGFIGVMCKDGNTYIYPSDLVYQVVHTTKETE
jgi:hypothetical protein